MTLTQQTQINEITDTQDADEQIEYYTITLAATGHETVSADKLTGDDMLARGEDATRQVKIAGIEGLGDYTTVNYALGEPVETAGDTTLYCVQFDLYAYITVAVPEDDRRSPEALALKTADLGRYPSPDIVNVEKHDVTVYAEQRRGGGVRYALAAGRRVSVNRDAVIEFLHEELTDELDGRKLGSKTAAGTVHVDAAGDPVRVSAADEMSIGDSNTHN